MSEETKKWFPAPPEVYITAGEENEGLAFCAPYKGERYVLASLAEELYQSVKKSIENSSTHPSEDI